MPTTFVFIQPQMAGKKKRGAKDVSTLGPATSKRAKSNDGFKSSAHHTRLSLEPLLFAETPTADDRKREAALYELLGSEDEEDRLAAANCIVLCLLGGEGVSELVLRRHLERRLFRGLASGRNASRLGFSLVITEVLAQLLGPEKILGSKYSGLTFDTVQALLVDKTQAVGNISGQEERDHYFGQLFGIECFVRSGILAVDNARWQSILNLLLKLGIKKVWLRPQCGWVLVQALERLSEEEVKTLLIRLEDAGMAKTPEGVAAWLVAWGRYPGLQVKPWRDPLSPKSSNDLAAVLKESFKASTKEPCEKVQGLGQQAGWSAQLHFVWDVILASFAKERAEAHVDGFHHFWNRVVDDGLFSKNSTDGQKFKGFMVFQKMLQGLIDQDAMLRCLFSKNFMACLMNQAAKEDRYLHRAAIKALNVIEGELSAHPSALGSVIEGLLGQNGTYNFDQRTSTKTIDKLLLNVKAENAEAVLTIIRRPMLYLTRCEEDRVKTNLRLYAEYLSKTLNALASDASIEPAPDSNRGVSYGAVLQELSELAYSRPEKIPPAALTEQFREFCRSRVESSLARLTHKADNFAILCRAVASMTPDTRIMSDGIKSAMDAALFRMNKLLNGKRKKNDDQSLAPALAMLHAVSLFQLYNGNADAMEVLEDLAQFYDRLESGLARDDSEKISELLVEILLSMVARPSSLMRQVSQQVFEAFTAHISIQGLTLLTDPLSSVESSKGEKELFDTGEDSMEIDGSGPEDSDPEQDSEVEVESRVSDGDDGEDEKRELEELEESIGKILNGHRLDKDDEADDLSSDGDMSDSEMLALDEKLVEVFKQRIKARPDSKKQKQSARQSVVNFKHRILDLVETYVRNQARSPRALGLVLPLLRLVRTTSTKSLANAACRILLSYQKGLKKARTAAKDASPDTAPASAPSLDSLLDLLVEVHDEARKDAAQTYAKAASTASLIVVSTMFAADRQTVAQIAAVYAKSWSDWVLGEARLRESFFTDWFNWSQNQASQAHS